jgi:NADH-quinone oxidoreductase subunit M
MATHWYESLLFWLTALPAFGALAVLPFNDRFAKWIALAFTLVGFALGAVLWCQFDSTSTAMQFLYAAPWIEPFGIRFALGVDGLALPLVVLTKLAMPVAVIASWGEERRARAFMVCYLMLDAAMTGTFLATDLFLFYVFWEAMLIPMLLIIGVWGSKDRVYASLKFFIFTFAGSILMLAAVFWLFSAYGQQFGTYTGDIASLLKVTYPAEPVLWRLTVQDLVFLGFTIAFAVKVPLFPLHTWLPDAHVQAPTGGSILLAAVLLKMGTYGLLRFSIPLCPVSFAKFAPTLAWLSVIGILYGAWVAYQQSDMKKLVAYSSVSHLGFIVLGICTMTDAGLTGAMLQMVNHGLSTGALFCLVGILYERRHSRELADMGGLAKVMPFYAILLVFVSASSMAVPGLNGFIGEFLVLFGTFQWNKIVGSVAVLGVIFGALYMLVMLRAVLFGPVTHPENQGLKDVTRRDVAALAPLCVFIVLLGVAPKPFLAKFERSLAAYWSMRMGSDKAVPPAAKTSDVKQLPGVNRT